VLQGGESEIASSLSAQNSAALLRAYFWPFYGAVNDRVPINPDPR
jgi:hypothetical protein